MKNLAVWLGLLQKLGFNPLPGTVAKGSNVAWVTAAARIGSLARELSHAAGGRIKKKKKKKPKSFQGSM